MPFKGSMMGLSSFVAFTKIPVAVLYTYQAMVDLTVPLYFIFEAV
jgi:hypothetical protein